MSGIDPAVASALASRIDILLSAISGPTDANNAQAADAPAATQWANAQPAPPGTTGADLPPASAQAILSQTALTLDVISRTGDDPTPPVAGRQPLWSTEPASATATAVAGAGAIARQAPDGLASSLAMALEQALDTSGLFYESHLGQWLIGARSSGLLEQEPQSQLPGAEDEQGWAYDPQQAGLSDPNTPAPFTGRLLADVAMASDETIDVEATVFDATFTEVDAAADTDAAAGGGLTAAADSAMQMDGAMQALAGPAPQVLPGNTPGAAANAPDPSAQAASHTSSALTPTPSPSAMAGTARGDATSSQFSSGSATAAYNAQATVAARLGVGSGAAQDAQQALAQGQPGPPAVPIHPDALTIVRQQLELLQSAEPQFRWSGEAWPNSRMYWELDWDQDDTRAAEQRVWRTRISLELPSLGLVDAELTLSGHRLGARIRADGQSVQALKEGTSDFIRALAGAGLDLEQLAIRHADGTPLRQSGGDI